MKHSLHFITPLILFVFTVQSSSQKIIYGSNQGKYQDINNTQIYYEEYGKGTPLLLLHGGGGSIVHFEQVIPDLAAKFRVIAIDSPGHGRSEMSDILSYQLLADYFSSSIDALKLDSVYIIGWSDGGNAALILAADRPEMVKKVIISGANIRLDGIAEQYYESITSVSPEVAEKQWGDWKEEYLNKAYNGNDWKHFVNDLGAMWRQVIYVPQEKMEKIRAKFMIVLGDRDLITLEHGIEMYQSIQGSEFLVLPNTGHMVFWEKPELITTIALDFLQ